VEVFVDARDASLHVGQESLFVGDTGLDLVDAVSEVDQVEKPIAVGSIVEGVAGDGGAGLLDSPKPRRVMP